MECQDIKKKFIAQMDFIINWEGHPWERFYYVNYCHNNSTSLWIIINNLSINYYSMIRFFQNEFEPKLLL